MLQDLPTDRIHRRDDARQINLANVEALASSIADIGLINPPRVRLNSDGWEVIAGSHRIEACKSLGLVEITCDVVEDDEDHAETAMIDENVIRQELSPVDRARYLSRRKELYAEMHPETRNTVSSQNLGSPRAQRFTQKIAEATGQSEQAVQLDITRGNRIIDEVMDMIRGTALDKGTYLDSLAKLPPNDQFNAAQRDLAHERDKTRQANAETQAAQLAAKSRRQAVQRAAEIIQTHVPEKELSALVAFLLEAGKAADVAREIETLL